MRRDTKRHAHTGSFFIYILTVLLAVLCVGFFAGCAKEKKPAHKRLPPRERKEPDSIRPYETPKEEALTPARQASDRLVKQGKIFLENDELERAASSFRDAINIDTKNGEAYYFLALTHVKLGEPDVAEGLLDKADALLGRDPEWSERIDQTRRDMGMGPKKEVAPSPIDEAF